MPSICVFNSSLQVERSEERAKLWGARILELRCLHEEMDRAVLRAYPKLSGVGSQEPSVVGWSDIAVPPFCIATEADQAALQAFEDEIIDRLFVLNELRAKAEVAPGKPKILEKMPKGGEAEPAHGEETARAAKAKSAKKAAPAKKASGKRSGGEQGSLF